MNKIITFFKYYNELKNIFIENLNVFNSNRLLAKKIKKEIPYKKIEFKPANRKLFNKYKQICEK